MLEIKGGYFFFTQHNMRKVYDRRGEDFQLSFSIPCWENIQIYGSLEFLEKYGKSLNGHQHTRIREFPISLGMQTIFNIADNMDYYFTIGPRYFFVWVKNNSSFVDRNKKKNGLGGFVNTGFLFHLTRHFFLDIFGEYSYKQMHFHSTKPNVTGHSVQVGGLTFGAGLGYSF